MLALDICDDEKLFRDFKDCENLNWAQKWYIVSSLSRLNNSFKITILPKIYLEALTSSGFKYEDVRDHVRHRLSAEEREIWGIRYEREHRWHSMSANDLKVILAFSLAIYFSRDSFDENIGLAILGVTISILSVVITFFMIKILNSLMCGRQQEA
jgi:hypothetical protein